MRRHHPLVKTSVSGTVFARPESYAYETGNW